MEQFFYVKVDMTREEAKTQANETGWKSLAQVEAIWDCLYSQLRMDMERKAARELFVALSWKLRCVRNLPEDKALYEAWWRYYYHTLNMSKAVAQAKMSELLLQQPERIWDSPEEAGKIARVLYLASDLTMEDGGGLAMRFKDAAQAEALWKSLYHTADFSKKDATQLLSAVLNWYFIEADWIEKKWKDLYYTQNMSKAAAQAALTKELIDWGYKTCRDGGA